MTTLGFIGYWDKDSGISCDDKSIRLAAWPRTGRLLLLVVNSGETGEFKVKLDHKRLGLPDPASWKAVDAEEGTSMKNGKDVIWDAAAGRGCQAGGRRTVSACQEARLSSGDHRAKTIGGIVNGNNEFVRMARRMHFTGDMLRRRGGGANKRNPHVSA